MDLSQYKLEVNQFDRYINSVNQMHFVIDFSTMLRERAAEVLNHLKGLPRSRCCFYVDSQFDKQITQLVGDKESGFCTEKMLGSIMPAWEEYSQMSLHQFGKDAISYVFFQQLSRNNQVCCLITGNETEAWQHILNERRGNVLLITDSCSYFFVEGTAFHHLSEKYGHIEPFTYIDVLDDGSSGKCELATLDKHLLFFKKRHTIRYTEVLNSDGAEGTIYNTDERDVAVKVFNRKVSEQKLKKLECLFAFEEKKENFAWPIEFVYSHNRECFYPIGFTMPLYSGTEFNPLEEFIYLDIVTNRHRWKVAISFLSQVLYLYIHGIQVGDYNFNNFSITDECQVVFMDMDSYIYGIYGTQVHGRQPLPFVPDYTNRSSMIKTDYFLLNSMVFWILSDGLWPYYYDEDRGQTICRIDIKEEKDMKEAMDKFPKTLRGYYKTLFKKEMCTDPFRLLFILLETEGYFFDN